MHRLIFWKYKHWEFRTLDDALDHPKDSILFSEYLMGDTSGKRDNDKGSWVINGPFKNFTTANRNPHLTRYISILYEYNRRIYIQGCKCLDTVVYMHNEIVYFRERMLFSFSFLKIYTTSLCVYTRASKIYTLFIYFSFSEYLL